MSDRLDVPAALSQALGLAELPVERGAGARPHALRGDVAVAWFSLPERGKGVVRVGNGADDAGTVSAAALGRDDPPPLILSATAVVAGLPRWSGFVETQVKE